MASQPVQVGPTEDLPLRRELLHDEMHDKPNGELHDELHDALLPCPVLAIVVCCAAGAWARVSRVLRVLPVARVARLSACEQPRSSTSQSASLFLFTNPLIGGTPTTLGARLRAQSREICGVEHEVRVTSGAPRLSRASKNVSPAQRGPRRERSDVHTPRRSRLAFI